MEFILKCALIFPFTTSQVHCAAASGNVQLMQWLLEKQYCRSRDLATGEPLLNAAGHSVLCVAARKGDREMMHYLLHSQHGSVTEISDVAILQRALHSALEVLFASLCTVL